MGKQRKMNGPQGLLRSAKRKKLEMPTSSIRTGETETKVKKTSDSEQKDVEVIEMPDTIDTEDELEQLFVLYDKYLASDRADPRLLFAIIHEADRILRNATEAMPAKFHLIYSHALAMNSAFAKDSPKIANIMDSSDNATSAKGSHDSPLDFLYAAIERADIGLATYPDNFELLLFRCDTAVTLLELRLKKRSTRYKNIEDSANLFQNALNDFDKSSEMYSNQMYKEINFKEEEGDDSIPYKVSGSTYKTLLFRISRLLELTFENEYFTSLFPNFYKWIDAKYNEAFEKYPTDLSYKRAKGELRLSQAAPYLVVSERQYTVMSNSDSENEEIAEEYKKQEEEATKTAIKLLKECIDCFVQAEVDEDGDFLVTIAEAQLSLANLRAGEEQDKLYQEVMERLTKAQELGVGDFSDVMADLQGHDDNDREGDHDSTKFSSSDADESNSDS
ncbi:negative regulator of Ofd1/Enhancer of translation termination 1 [Lipomyces oligophaga]|uniref:negative regulator of Ofd1/Enhancer of translation termination 1 n=1 Tax=Lipomyces oligophaga TaxID=45792 RepID=UPI0034CEC0FE